MTVTLANLVSTALQTVSGAPALDDGADAIPLSRLAERAWIDASPTTLADRSVIVLTRRPLSAAAALCTLDGHARRLVLTPADVGIDHLPRVVAEAEADAVVHDFGSDAPHVDGVASYRIGETEHPRFAAPDVRTEWCLFTSGTSGPPKMVVHDLEGLIDAIPRPAPSAERVLWATFYDIRRYGGLQMLLRALIGGRTLLLPGVGEPVAAFLGRVGAAAATHVAGTPTHWRSALMSDAIAKLKPQYVRLSGEIADQAVLDQLAGAFPGAAVGHAFATTEAGVCFEVSDGLEGFPATYLERSGPVELRIEGGTLHVRSRRIARGRLGADEPIAGPDGFVDTGDLIGRRGDRCLFLGRANGVINVGGMKVHPEEVEAVLNRLPGVRLARVGGRANPITGAIVVAEVMLEDPSRGLGEAARALRDELRAQCLATLPPHKVPASIRFVESLPTSAAGKLERRGV